MMFLFDGDGPLREEMKDALRHAFGLLNVFLKPGRSISNRDGNFNNYTTDFMISGAGMHKSATDPKSLFVDSVAIIRFFHEGSSYDWSLERIDDLRSSEWFGQCKVISISYETILASPRRLLDEFLNHLRDQVLAQWWDPIDEFDANWNKNKKKNTEPTPIADGFVRCSCGCGSIVRPIDGTSKETALPETKLTNPQTANFVLTQQKSAQQLARDARKALRSTRETLHGISGSGREYVGNSLDYLARAITNFKAEIKNTETAINGPVSADLADDD